MYQVWRKQGNWLNLGGNQWICNNSSYIRYEGKQTSTASSIVGKRVVSKVDNLRFYDSLSWQDKGVAGTVGKELGFEIVDKISVNGSSQYKIKNSRGNVYYITASPYYVRVR